MTSPMASSQVSSTDSSQLSSTTTVPVKLVQKMKSGKGINPIIDKIKKDFSIDVDFDGKDKLQLIGDRHLVDIAYKRLERNYGKLKEDPIVDVEEGKVVWKFSDDSSFILTRLYMEDIRSFPNVEQAPSSPNSPKMLVLTCDRKHVSDVMPNVKALTGKVTTAERKEVDVRKKIVKAKQFCDTNDVEGCYYEYDATKKQIVFIGKDKLSIKSLKDKWTSFSNKKEADPSPNREDLKVKQDDNKDSNTKHTTNFKESEGLNQSTTNRSQQKQNKPDATKPPTSKSRAEIDETHEESTQVPSASIPDRGAIPKDSIGGNPQFSPASNDYKGQQQRPQNDKHNKDNASSTTQDIVGPATNNSNQYEFPVGRIKVLVYKQSIVDIKNMDAIVNAANEHLAHGGGIAFYISKAAGSAMDKECNMFVKKKGPLPVSKVYTSQPGNMNCKGILHAVGPRWSQYIGMEDKCAKDLYETVHQCLKTMQANRWRNMALCAISSGIFGVPKPLCTAMYLKAIEDFAVKHPDTDMEVHFIDVVQDILDQMIQTHKERLQRVSSPDFDMAFNFPRATQGYWGANGNRLDNRKGQGRGRGQGRGQSGQYGGQGGDNYQQRTPRSFQPEPDQRYARNYDLTPHQTPRSSRDLGKGGDGFYPNLDSEYADAGWARSEDKHRSPPSAQDGWEEYIPEKVDGAEIDIEMFCKGSVDTPKYKSIKINPQPWDISEGTCEYHPKKTAAKQFPCKHKYCHACFVYSKDVCKKCVAAEKSKKTEPEKTVEESDAEEKCPICMETCKEPATLKCGHKFCKGCLKSAAAVKPLCPTCNKPFGVVTGTQPDGRLFVNRSSDPLPGYEKCGQIVVMYHFEDGVQKDCHPNPGKPYKGIQRRGYLPDNAEGQRVLRLLKKAFARRLIFTIGRSVTTGQDNMITWNDIHHKTSPYGDKFSYPDPDYLSRVQGELAAKGITE